VAAPSDYRFPETKNFTRTVFDRLDTTRAKFSWEEPVYLLRARIEGFDLFEL
jgi:hypothetical protein